MTQTKKRPNPETEWISVKDRLPEPPKGEYCSSEVLIATVSYVKYGYLDGYKKWQAYINDGDESTEYVFPTHWMPLPEPPK
jgi:hypothetical protein